MHRTRAALPEDEYLTKIGEIAYTISYIESGVIYDLPRLSRVLPDGLDVASVEPLTTGQLARRLEEAVPKITDDAVREYIRRNAVALRELAPLRNDLLHARPATDSMEKQCLLRVVVRRGVPTGEQRWIDDRWFEESVGKINHHMTLVSDARPSFESYPSHS